MVNNKDIINIIEFFYNSDADVYRVRDDAGNVIEEVTRNQVVNALQNKTSINYTHIVLDKKIKMLLTDCDGCLTDAGMYYSENGDELKKFNTKDGMGFSFLRERGIITGIITGENRELNRRRAAKLKLDIIESGCSDKLTKVKELCEKYGITLDEVAYIGDDMNDIDVIKNVKFGCCPADAVMEVRKAAKFITSAKGGEGVIREVIDYLIDNNLV